MTGEQDTGRPNRWWIGAAVSMVVLSAAARGLSRTEQFRDGPLGHWYGYAGLALVIAAGYAAVRWLVSRAHRRRQR
ncbi:MAG: hypothetical protein QOC94_2222 [Actinoplanes sp.]|jgi:hypothetical protein|nr:hypothetical protein [Actinoplanes sp.]